MQTQHTKANNSKTYPTNKRLIAHVCARLRTLAHACARLRTLARHARPVVMVDRRVLQCTRMMADRPVQDGSEQIANFRIVAKLFVTRFVKWNMVAKWLTKWFVKWLVK